MTKTDKRPVLDSDDERGMVIGWAENGKEAAELLTEWRRSIDPNATLLVAHDLCLRTDPVTYDPDINTREEAEAVESLGAYAPTWPYDPTDPEN